MVLNTRLHLCPGTRAHSRTIGEGARVLIHSRSSTRSRLSSARVGATCWRPIRRTVRVHAEGDVSVAENGGLTASSEQPVANDGLSESPAPVDDIATDASPPEESVAESTQAESSGDASPIAQIDGEMDLESGDVYGEGTPVEVGEPTVVAEGASKVAEASSSDAGAPEESTPKVHTNIRKIPYVPMKQVDHPFKVGDVVVGRVKWCGTTGAKVDLVDYPYEGMCWSRYMPVELQDNLPETDQSNAPKAMMMPELVREFKIQAIADDCKPGGKGPLLTARDVDQNLNNRRLSQIMDICKRDREVINAHMVGINSGGVRCTLVGIGAFLPRSHCIRESRDYVEDAELHEKYVGQEKPVALIGLDRLKEKVVVSETRALESNAMRAIQPGSLVWGSVRRIEEWGVFVGIDNTQMSCLLHISNVSQATVNDIQDVFAKGDRVCGVVISMEENFSRISISTADLEESAGDMLIDKEKVYANAPAAVEQIQREIDAQREQYLQQQEQEEY